MPLRPDAPLAPSAAPPGQAYVDPDAIRPPPRPAPPREVGTVTPHRKFTLTVGAGKLLSLPTPAATVFVADPSIADVQPPSASSVFVFGKKPGGTTLFALTREGKPILAYNVVVEYDLSTLQQTINDAAPGSNVQLSRTPHGLVLTGAVPTPEAAANLQSIAQRYAAPNETVLNMLQVGGSTQVNLRVRVAEVSRSVSRQLGFNWTAALSNIGSFGLQVATGLPTGAASSFSGFNGGNNANVSSPTIGGTYSGSKGTASAALDAMADEGLVTLLAEPNLTTTSGQPASFLAGGEYPIPVPQGLGSVGIEYKQYGVSVAFTPTVLNSGMISMKVSPEVSELSAATSVAIPNGGSVPALISRRADTTVQLASGQSFAIGGLIQNNAQNNIAKVPWLGDIPILGALFRSTQFQRDETELVIVVTAYIVHPTDRMPALPTDDVRQTSDLERLFLDRALARGTPRFDPEHMPHLQGAAGYLFE
ncbi:type II and III secretion system protein family protein [Rhizosaccharibacter radicis]|uniref:Type II and III secretion system protein family protein n=1 Tax=Rhizosaccharibacter radicis TaxID=2782605 RepID=A0ABT1VTG4_9PROT|nr:type II and III secretion system protein family protein [Acetobacteraceae bacterium KSS12]